MPHIKLDNFEGPYDLLIELAREHRLDLTTVSLAKITGGFLAYMARETIPAGLHGDFLVVAATLLLLKIHHLLPEISPEEAEEITELTDRVRIYQLYREQAHELRRAWGRDPLLPAPERLNVNEAVFFPNITSGLLLTHMQAVVSTAALPQRPTRHLRPRPRSLQECLALFEARLQAVREIIFQQELAGQSAHDTAISFLAVLELARRREVSIAQAESCAPLTITPL